MRWIISDWKVKLVCLFLASALWAYVRGWQQERLAVMTLYTPIEISGLPRGVRVTGIMPTGMASVTVRGKPSAIFSLRPSDVRPTIIIPSTKVGRVEKELRKSDVVVPKGVEVVELSPSRVFIELEEEIISRILPVKARVLAGDGISVTSIGLSPQTVTVSGPYRKVKGMEYVETIPIEVSHEGEISKVVELSNPGGLDFSPSRTVRVKIKAKALRPAAPEGEGT